MRASKAPLAVLTASLLVATAPAAGAPTFDAVLAAPDDVNLQIAYAEAEADAGHLLPAAAALERVLMKNPDAQSVRLLYAVVLYRLDDLQGARLQLRMVDATRLNDLQRAELGKYRRLVNGASSDTHFSGRLSAGLAYDSDATGSLVTLFDYLPIQHKSGDSMVYSGDLAFSSKVGDAGDLAVYGAAHGYSKTFIQGPRANFQHLDAEAGLSGEGLKHSWRLGAFAHRYILFDSPYLTEYGLHGEASWRPNTSTIVTASLELAKQDFREPAIDPFAWFIGGTHDGWRGDAQAGITYRLDARSTLGAVASYEYKLASYGPFSYTAPGLEANYHRLLGLGAYLDVAGDVRWFDYRKVDWFFLFPATKKRSDTDLYLRAAIGVPLSAFAPGGATGDALENIVLEGSVNYTSRNTIQPLDDYDSTGAMLRLVWHFGDDR